MSKFMLAALVCLSVPMFGQKLSQDLSKHWATSKDLTLAVADAMPDADYTFKPNPQEMSFGEQMTHIGAANAFYCSQISGDKGVLPRPKESDKATAKKYLAETFDYCGKIISAQNDEGLSKMIGPEGRQVSLQERLLGAFVHTAHHRGQAEVYLRVKDVKPPTYKF